MFLRIHIFSAFQHFSPSLQGRDPCCLKMSQIQRYFHGFRVIVSDFLRVMTIDSTATFLPFSPSLHVQFCRHQVLFSLLIWLLESLIKTGHFNVTNSGMLWQIFVPERGFLLFYLSYCILRLKEPSCWMACGRFGFLRSFFSVVAIIARNSLHASE